VFRLISNAIPAFGHPIILLSLPYLPNSRFPYEQRLIFQNNFVSVILGGPMKPVPIPRLLIILSMVLVAVIFMAGVLHAFGTAQAASTTPAPLAGQLAKSDIELTPTPALPPASVSGDTTGIIALAILIVVIVLVGAVLGGNKPYNKKTF
jgi:hypothetical protein